jgi:hypothetical protein
MTLTTPNTTYTGRYTTDVITDLAIDFLEQRPRDRPFFLMMHHKAPHRPWEPNEPHASHFAARRIPEPVTFWDSYETRTDALRENEQRVAADLTNRDLKLPRPPSLDDAAFARSHGCGASDSGDQTSSAAPNPEPLAAVHPAASARDALRAR